MRHRIYIVEDHPVMRIGFAALIRQEADLEVCGEAETAQEALDAIPKAAPDLVLVDVALPGMSGLELVKQLRTQHPALPLLVISAHDEVLYAERALRAGAQGYLMKHEAAAKVIEAIRHVLQGRLYVSNRMQNRLLEQHVRGSTGEPVSSLDQLSDRELEVFRHIGDGLTTNEIADRMLISPKTVETYRANIKKKLGVANTKELMQKAVLWAHGKV